MSSDKGIVAGTYFQTQLAIDVLFQIPGMGVLQ